MGQHISSYKKLMEEAKREFNEMMAKEQLFVSPKRLLDYFVPEETDEPEQEEPSPDDRTQNTRKRR